MAKGPVLIDMEGDTPPPVSEAAPVPEQEQHLPEMVPHGGAMQSLTRLATRKPSRLVRWFWSITAALLLALLSAAAWSFVTGWIATQPVVGWIFAGLMAAFILLLILIALRELAALARLGRIDAIRRSAEKTREDADLQAAQNLSARLLTLYKGREDVRWGIGRFQRLAADQLDAAGHLSLAEKEIIAPLDAQAEREIESAARQVATVTALVPLALADVVAALTSNLRMIRRIAEIYGGRGGTFGAWRLTRAVIGHLVATGAVAVGDDMLEPILGGSLLGKLSRRFGEGLVNGALTARVGVAAMDVCRPMPFAASDPPRASKLVRQALAGFVPGKDG